MNIALTGFSVIMAFWILNETELGFQHLSTLSAGTVVCARGGVRCDGKWMATICRTRCRKQLYQGVQKDKHNNKEKTIDGYGSRSTNSNLAGLYLLLYIRQHAGLFQK
jgi:hypothetical protein